MRMLGRWNVPGCCPGTRANKPGIDCDGGWPNGTRAGEKPALIREIADGLAEFEEDRTGLPVYTATAKPWAGGWELHIDGIGVTQCRTLDESADVILDYILLETGVWPGGCIVDMIVDP